MAREDYYNGILAMAEEIASKSRVFRPPYWFASIHNGEDIVGCGIYSEPDGLLASDMPSAAIYSFYQNASSVVRVPNRITAPPDVSRLIAQYWTRDGQFRAKIEDCWNIYRLDSVRQHNVKTTGVLRAATPSDQELLADWGRRYRAESGTHVNVADFFIRKLNRQHLFVWEDHRPKTVATISAPTENGIRISAVYTPEEFRGNGYAKEAVWSLSKQLIEKNFEFVTLSTIADDCQQNLYKDLGFYKIGERHTYSILACTN